MPKYIVTFVLMLFFCQIILADDSARVTSVKLVTNADKTKVIFNLIGKSESSVFFVGDPSRIVIDLNNTVMATHIGNNGLRNTIVKGIRYATHDDGVLRIVLDLRKNTQFEDKVVYGKKGKVSLVVSIVDPIAAAATLKRVQAKKREKQVDKQSEVNNNSIPNKTENQPATIPPATVAVQIPLTAKSEDSTTIQKSTNSSLTENNKMPESTRLRDITIVIDPGHGGKDPGVTGVHKTKEKDVVLAIAKNLRKLLNMEVGIKAVLTRNDDYFLPLKERLRIAHANKADLFISLHADAYKRHSISGVSVFALAEHGATSEVAKWLAVKENASELENGLSQSSAALRSVLFGLAQKNTIETSLAIGDSIITQLSAIAKVHSHKIEQANFIVLKSSDIPSLLMETGFLSDPKEEDKLADLNYEQNLAKAIEVGIVNYFRSHPTPDTYLSVVSPQSNSAKLKTIAVNE